MNTLQRYDFIIKDRFRFHRLGDTSMHVTGNIYSHVTKKMETRAVKLFDSYMNEK